jgi:nucleoside-diphosphate-sugar epimerase
MDKVLLTGSTGFVGRNIQLQLKNNYSIIPLFKGSPISIKQDVILHFAGKAHDLKNVSDPSEYYTVNTELTKKLIDAFLSSDAKVKAAADTIESQLTEDYLPNPITDYGKSKLLAEQYILSKSIPEGKRVYILRPCMIHGPSNKGNLNLLYKIVSKGFPWPLGAFENKRSFCSIDNLCFIINELVNNDSIASGVYNVADDEPLATNELIKLIAESQGKKYLIWNVPKSIIKLLSKMGDFLKLPLNSERLNKLTETYIVSNTKIITAINKPLPLSAKEGLMKTLNSFNANVK